MSALHFIALVLLTGCSTPRQAPVDLAQPGWSVRQGQAAWRPRGNASELAGELLVASHPEHGSFVQFLKTPFPIVSAQAGPAGWQIEFGQGQRRFAGRGCPPARLVWFQLPGLISGERLLQPWEFESAPDSHWRIENRRTGERLEGYLNQ